MTWRTPTGALGGLDLADLEDLEDSVRRTWGTRLGSGGLGGLDWRALARYLAVLTDSGGLWLVDLADCRRTWQPCPQQPPATAPSNDPQLSRTNYHPQQSSRTIALSNRPSSTTKVVREFDWWVVALAGKNETVGGSVSS
eukprot:gene9316-biopygen7966